MMKVLHIIGSLTIGGAQRLISDIVSLQATEVDVEILVCELEDNMFVESIRLNGIKIHSLNYKQKSLSIILKLIPWLKKYDIIHVHLFPLLYWTALASLFTKCKLVYTEHSTSNRRRNQLKFKWIERFIYSRYKKIACISLQTQEALQKWLNAKEGRFVVINNGVNIEKFSTASQTIRKKQIIMISRFVPAKDQMTVIRAMKYVNDTLRLFFVGNGETMDECKQLAEQEGIIERIKFLGSREDVDKLIGESLIGVQSSHWEGFGLTAVEMMAGGLPVIASDVNGLKQVVEGAGLLFEQGNECKLAEHINQLYGNIDFYTEVKTKCFERAKIYSIAETATNYIRLYKQIMM